MDMTNIKDPDIRNAMISLAKQMEEIEATPPETLMNTQSVKFLIEYWSSLRNHHGFSSEEASDFSSRMDLEITNEMDEDDLKLTAQLMAQYTATLRRKIEGLDRLPGDLKKAMIMKSFQLNFKY